MSKKKHHAPELLYDLNKENAHMAAAFIPLIAGVAPSIINLIAGLVHKSAPAAEAANGPGTGPVKFAQVLNEVTTALQTALTSGQIQSIPNEDQVKMIIQSVVSSLQLLGQLGGTAAVPAAPASTPASTTPAATPAVPGAGATMTTNLKIVGGTIQIQQ